MVFKGQTIDSGDNSTNIQGKEVTVIQNNSGLSYSEVKDIAMNVFKNNFYELGEKVEKIVQERAENILDDYLEKLSSKNSESIKNTQDPDVRYVIYEAQKDHARRGDDNIKKLLVDMLIERTLSNNDINSLVLNEALKVTSKLTIKQINLLSFIFLIKHLNFVREVPIEDYIDMVKAIQSLFNLLPNDHAFEHLQYASCISISIGSIEFDRIISHKFPQINDENQARTIISSNQYLQELSSVWNNTRCRNCSLTSVGIAIAIMNIKAKTDLDLDLNIFIYE